MQNQRAWTAGLISRKVRGLRAKLWTKKEIFLNRLGLRVEYRKLQGLFNKNGSPKGYARIRAVGSGSSGWERSGGLI